MTAERDPTEGDIIPGRDLPAPYVSPWSEFGRTLTALLADVRLRIRALWRRNGEGSLVVPGFWPRDLAPSFWPLLLVLVVLGVLLLGRVGLQQLKPSGPGSTVLAGPDHPVVVGVEPAGDPAMESRDNPAVDRPIADQPAAVEPSPIPSSAVEPDPQPQPEPEPESELDPLVLLLMTTRDPVDLLLAAKPDPSNDMIQLQVAANRWWQLFPERREQLARQWQQHLIDLGYERLTLVDEQAHPLGRSALVGTGMILVNADDDPDQ